MSSNPSQPAPQWPASAGSASPEPLDPLPAPEGSFAADRLRHTGPHQAWPAGQGRWPTARAPWPGPASAEPADAPERAPAEQGWVVTQERPVTAAGAEGAEDPPNPDDVRLAMLSYLGVPFLGPVLPLVVYLIKRRTSGFIRFHAAQALSLAVTALLYTICVLILGGVLALDTLNLALAIAVPAAALLWLAILGYVIVAASRAYRGRYYKIPSWLCATIVR